MAFVFSPASLEVTESAPASVTHFRVKAKRVGSGDVIRDQTFAASGSTVTVISLATGYFQPDDIGAQVFFTVQEQGIGGDGPEQTKMLPDNSAAQIYAVMAAPDGAEDIVVNV